MTGWEVAGAALSTSGVAGTAVWRWLLARQAKADATATELLATLREDCAAARAERDHERAERTRERLEAAALTADLGRRLDALRDKARDDAEAVTKAIARLTSPAQMRAGDVWAEMPTQVRNRCELVAVALAPAEEARLGRFARGERLTTPPRGMPKLPPPRQHSPK